MHTIYFDEELCNKLSSFIGKTKGILIDFQVKEYDESASRIWSAVAKEFSNNVASIKKDLESSFRNMLGVNSS